MTRKTRKAIFWGAGAVLAVGIAAALVVTMPLIKMAYNSKRYTFASYDNQAGGDRIHFMNTQSADAILLESGGKFALIDAAEDSDNPRNLPELAYDGYEERVLAYLKKAAGDAAGKVELEFIAGTHAHSDHLGGFDTILADPAVTVRKAYVKEYQPELITEYEKENWDNQEVYDQMIQACADKSVQVIHDIPDTPFQFGNFTITFMNTQPPSGTELRGENENSLGVLVEKDGYKAFLAGDINNYNGTEDMLASKLGHVDVLKVGHHGYAGSTSKGFAQALSPDIAILTNTIHGIDKEVRKTLNSVGASIYAAKENNGIIVSFQDNAIQLYQGIHDRGENS